MSLDVSLRPVVALPSLHAKVTYENRTPQSATTDNRGEFRLLLPSRRTVNLLVEHAEHGEKRLFNHNGAPISAANLQGQVLEITLGTGYPKLTLRGRIVDAETGEPLAGLPVVAGFDPIAGAAELNLAQVTGSFARETDADGRFEISGLPVNDVHLVGQAMLDGKLYALKEAGSIFRKWCRERNSRFQSFNKTRHSDDRRGARCMTVSQDNRLIVPGCRRVAGRQNAPTETADS